MEARRLVLVAARQKTDRQPDREATLHPPIRTIERTRFNVFRRCFHLLFSVACSLLFTLLRRCPPHSNRLLILSPIIMPATSGRVRMPHNNRMATSGSLKTSNIWSKTIGHNPYAAESEEKEATDSAADTEKARGLMELARSQNLTGNSGTRDDFARKMYLGLKEGKKRRSEAANQTAPDSELQKLLAQESSSSEDEVVKVQKKSKPKRDRSSSSDDDSSSEEERRARRKRRREKRKSKKRRKKHRKHGESRSEDESASDEEERRRTRRKKHRRRRESSGSEESASDDGERRRKGREHKSRQERKHHQEVGEDGRERKEK